MRYRKLVVVAAIAALHATPPSCWAAANTCLTDTDPSVDRDQIAAVRALIDTKCVCSEYDGSRGKTHAKYVTCASSVIRAQAGAGNLRTQCKATVKKYYSVSTCGVPASKGSVPCLKTSATGKVTCAIKPSTRCTGTACAGFSTCIDAADTSGDGIIGLGDSGACAPSVEPARFVDNGDGTITDNQTGLMWEKKDQAGGLHDVNDTYLWAGFCSDDNDQCQPDAAAVAACTAELGSAFGCTLCGGTGVTCETRGTITIWQWLNQLNAAGLGGHSDWRIPTVGQDGDALQLETVLAAQFPNCTSSPCVPPAFDDNCMPGCTVDGNGAPICSCTAPAYYWSATTYTAAPEDAWGINFSAGSTGYDVRGYAYRVRAVR